MRIKTFRLEVHHSVISNVKKLGKTFKDTTKKKDWGKLCYFYYTDFKKDAYKEDLVVQGAFDKILNRK